MAASEVKRRPGFLKKPDFVSEYGSGMARQKNEDGYTMTKTGKPYKPGPASLVLDEDAVYQMALVGCTYGEIAGKFGVSVEKVSRSYKELIAKGWAERNEMLRQLQLECASGMNAAMLIHLGKTELKQSEVRTEDAEAAKVEIPLGYQITIRSNRKADLQEEDDNGGDVQE